MSRYRKVDVRIWNDQKFRALSDKAKLVFLFLLTHPNMTALGAMRATVGGLAAELDWEVEAFRGAFCEILERDMAEHDSKAHFLALPKFLRYNKPESPNVVKAWRGSLDQLPECGLKGVTVQRARAFSRGLTESFREAFREAFSKTTANQEQEQETGTENQKLSSTEGMERKVFLNALEVEDPLPQRREGLSSDGNEQPDSSRKTLNSEGVPPTLSPHERSRAAIREVEEKESKAQTSVTTSPVGSTWNELQARTKILK